MFRVSHRTLLILSGIVWMTVGILLLNTGLVLLMNGFQAQGFSAAGYSELFSWLSRVTNGPDTAAVVLIAVSIALGFFKGRLVLQKAAAKSFTRIKALDNPTSITNLYTRQNALLIAGMMLLGMSMRYFGLCYDIRGAIDAAVGCALMQGAISYFQYASFALQKPTL